MRIAGWGALAVSVAVYAIVGLLAHQPFQEGARTLGYFDLRVYHGAALRLVSGQEVYGTPVWKGFNFTYPPFAALVFLPLAAGGAIWLEPVSVTLGYGQINLLIAALVVFDLSLPDDHRAQGIAIGVAAAIKLTPLLLIAYLLLAARRRVAARASLVFAGSIALAYVLLPDDAAAYWGHGLFFHASRVGDAADVANQSLRGALARLSHTGQLTTDGYLLIGVVVLTGLALAVSAARRGDQAAGFSLAALSTLLASPISWTHHWTLVAPALLLLARRAHERHSVRLWVALAALLALGYAYAPEHLAEVPGLHPGPLTLLTTDPYPLAAILVLAAGVAVTARRRVKRRKPSPGPGTRGLPPARGAAFAPREWV